MYPEIIPERVKKIDGCRKNDDRKADAYLYLRLFRQLDDIGTAPPQPLHSLVMHVIVSGVPIILEFIRPFLGLYCAIGTGRTGNYGEFGIASQSPRSTQGKAEMKTGT